MNGQDDAAYLEWCRQNQVDPDDVDTMVAWEGRDTILDLGQPEPPEDHR